MTTPDQPIGMNELREHYMQEIEYLLETSDAAGEVRVTYGDGHSEVKDSKVLLLDDIIRFVDAYVAGFQQLVERCMPAKKTLKTDLDDDNIIGYDDPHRYCVECGQYEYEGVLNCRCVGFNQAIDQVRHNLQQAGLLRGDDVTKGGTE